jgi:hypothetical protein
MVLVITTTKNYRVSQQSRNHRNNKRQPAPNATSISTSMLTTMIALSTLPLHVAGTAATTTMDLLLEFNVLAPNACPCWDLETLLSADQQQTDPEDKSNDHEDDLPPLRCGPSPVTTHDPDFPDVDPVSMNRTKWEFTTKYFPLGSACTGYGCYLDTPEEACVFLPTPSTWPDGYKAAKLISPQEQYACAFLLAAACGVATMEHHAPPLARTIPTEFTTPSTLHTSPSHFTGPDPVAYGLDPQTLRIVKAVPSTASDLNENFF